MAVSSQMSHMHQKQHPYLGLNSTTGTTKTADGHCKKREEVDLPFCQTLVAIWMSVGGASIMYALDGWTYTISMFASNLESDTRG